MRLQDTGLLGMLFPGPIPDTSNLTVDEIDAKIGALDCNTLKVTNLLRTMNAASPVPQFDRVSADARSLPTEMQMHVRSVFDKHGLEQILETCLDHRSALIRARSCAKE